MPKTITLDKFKGTMRLWVDEEGDMQMTVDYTQSGGGFSQSGSEDRTSKLTTAERTVIVNFAKKQIAAVKLARGM